MCGGREFIVDSVFAEIGAQARGTVSVGGRGIKARAKWIRRLSWHAPPAASLLRHPPPPTPDQVRGRAPPHSSLRSRREGRRNAAAGFNPPARERLRAVGRVDRRSEAE